jgi:glyoxylase-like metal-dependent hydrolase (beta-lactamase superfamily II)
MGIHFLRNQESLRCESHAGMSDLVSVTGHRQRESWLAKELPEPEQLRPGLWSIPLPIPIGSLGYVISYVFESDSGLAIIDPGWDYEDASLALARALAQFGRRIDDIDLIVGTHFHTDHVGIAGRLHDLTGARVAAANGNGRRTLASLAAAGVPQEDFERLSGSTGSARSPLNSIELRLNDGDVLPIPGWTLRTIWTPGHTAGHICFYEEHTNLLLSGDHVLPKITPNISYYADTDIERDPVREYVASLRRLSIYKPVEVLPAHLWRFTELQSRLDDLVSHHGKRLSEVREAIQAGNHSTWDIAHALTWSRPWTSFAPFMEHAALSETLAHLVALERQSVVEHELGERDNWVLPGSA